MPHFLKIQFPGWTIRCVPIFQRVKNEITESQYITTDFLEAVSKFNIKLCIPPSVE